MNEQLTRNDSVISYVARINRGDNFSENETSECFQLLRSHECWQPLIKLLQKQGNLKQNLIELAKIYNLHLDDTSSAINICLKIILECRISYREFYLSVLPVISETDAFFNHAKILSAVAPHVGTAERIEVLKDLCFIYDKRLFDSDALHTTHEQILSIDPYNIRTLRYFKHYHAQQGQWGEVARILTLLLEHIRAEEKPRTAYELAGIMIYRQGEYQKGIDLITQYSAMTNLDSFGLLYDAYGALKNWTMCATLIADQINKATGNQQTILLFKLGDLQFRLNESANAIKTLEQLLENDPIFFDAYDLLVSIFVKERNWSKVKNVLQHLLLNLTDKNEQLRIKKILDQL